MFEEKRDKKQLASPGQPVVQTPFPPKAVELYICHRKMFPLSASPSKPLLRRFLLLEMSDLSSENCTAN